MSVGHLGRHLEMGSELQEKGLSWKYKSRHRGLDYKSQGHTHTHSLSLLEQCLADNKYYINVKILTIIIFDKHFISQLNLSLLK